jgi:hypothetical protein
VRSLATQHPQDFAPPAPDTVHTFVMAAATAQAADFPSTGEAHYMSINGTVAGFIAYGSTAVAIPSTSVTSGSSGIEAFSGAPGFNRRIPSGSTGYSIITPTSGYVTASFWN